MGARGEDDADAKLAADDPLTQGLLREMVGLRARLARITRDPEVAADILQDAIVTVLQKLHNGELTDRAQLAGYAYRVALNHWRNYRRKDKSAVSDPQETFELPDNTPGWKPAESLESAQWAKLVTKLLAEIRSERDRELLVRFYLHEESKERLCEVFGLTALHFNRVIDRARDRFRELLERRGLRKADFLSIGAILFGVG